MHCYCIAGSVSVFEDPLLTDALSFILITFGHEAAALLGHRLDSRSNESIPEIILKPNTCIDFFLSNS